MLKTTGSTESATNPKKIENKVGENSVVGNSMVGDDEIIN